MKATIERATLLKSLSHVQSVVERRNTIPILSNVLLEAQEDGALRVRLTASANYVWMISSNMLGIDPVSTFATGSNAVGFENGAPPTMRSFLFGVTVGF